jgi:hypothetical protein
MFPTCIASQLEAKPNIVNMILSHIQENRSSLTIKEARVISLTDDIPQQSHSIWAAAYVRGDAKQHCDAVEASAAVSTASDINLKFLSFGQQLQCVLPGLCPWIRCSNSAVRFALRTESSSSHVAMLGLLMLLELVLFHQNNVLHL